MKDFVYSDFDSYLNITDSGNVKVIYDEEVIIQSIKHIMATLSGERVRSDFGGSLVRVLFEPMSQYTVENIRRIISSAIGIYEPRVEISQLVITPDYDLGAYDVRLELIIRSLNRRLTYPIKLNTFQ
jgi:phage baseplate assembly protein W